MDNLNAISIVHASDTIAFITRLLQDNLKPVNMRV